LGGASAENEDILWEAVATDMAESCGDGGGGIAFLYHQSRSFLYDEFVAIEESRFGFVLGIIARDSNEGCLCRGSGQELGESVSWSWCAFGLRLATGTNRSPRCASAVSSREDSSLFNEVQKWSARHGK
jgi:hypothetical protein